MSDQNSSATTSAINNSSQQNANQPDPLNALEELLDEAKKKQEQAGEQQQGRGSAQAQTVSTQKTEQQNQQKIQKMKQQRQQEDREKIKQKLKQIQGAKQEMPDEQTAPIVRNKRDRIADRYQIKQLQHTKIKPDTKDN